MEIGMEHAFKAGFDHLMGIIGRIVPGMNNELDGMNNDNLGKISGWLVKDKILDERVSHRK